MHDRLEDYDLSPGERQKQIDFNQILYTALFIALCIGGFLGCAELKKTDNWVQTTGVLVARDLGGKTIAYTVNGMKLTTRHETTLQVIAARFGVSVPSSGSKSVTRVNGVDPELGKQVTVYYNPDNPSEAATTRGISGDFILPLVCVGLLVLIYAIVSLGGWNVSELSRYQDYDY